MAQENISEVPADATPSDTREGFTAPSPRPWHYHRGDDYVVIQADGGDVTGCVMYPDEESEANHAFILRACNAHDDLLAASKRVHTLLIAKGLHNTPQGEALLAAISKATGV